MIDLVNLKFYSIKSLFFHDHFFLQSATAAINIIILRITTWIGFFKHRFYLNTIKWIGFIYHTPSFKQFVFAYIFTVVLGMQKSGYCFNVSLLSIYKETAIPNRQLVYIYNVIGVEKLKEM